MPSLQELKKLLAFTPLTLLAPSIRTLLQTTYLRCWGELTSLHLLLSLSFDSSHFSYLKNDTLSVENFVSIKRSDLEEEGQSLPESPLLPRGNHQEPVHLRP